MHQRFREYMSRRPVKSAYHGDDDYIVEWTNITIENRRLQTIARRRCVHYTPPIVTDLSSPNIARPSIRPATRKSSLDLAPIILTGDGAEDVGVLVSLSADKTPVSPRLRAATQPTLRTKAKNQARHIIDI